MPNNQEGALPLFLIVAVVSLIAFVIIANTYSFKNTIFSSLFPKQFSFAVVNNAVEAETGTLTSPATILSDSNASGGQYIQFGGVGIPTPVPTLVNDITTLNRNSSYNGRFYSSSSAWNSPIPSNAQVDAKNSLIMATTDSSQLSLGYWMANKGNFQIADDNFGYSSPLWYADLTVPAIAVKDANGWFTCQGCPFSLSPVKIPANAVSASGTDHHMVVWDISNNTIYEFWGAVKNTDGTWSTGVAVSFDINGVGHRDFNDHWHTGARAVGASLLGGLIRYQEIRNGVIDHALSFVYPTPQNHHYAQGLGVDGVSANIASHSDGDSMNNDTNYNLPEGARIRLKSSVDVTSRCLGRPHPSTCQIIGNALKIYGAYLVDRGGHPAIAAEDLTNKAVSWSGLLDTYDTSSFQPGDFEVMSMPAILQAQPGY